MSELQYIFNKNRLSDDVPAQSDSIPLINYYFTLCICFTLCSMAWFSYMNHLKEIKFLPERLHSFILKYLSQNENYEKSIYF